MYSIKVTAYWKWCSVVRCTYLFTRATIEEKGNTGMNILTYATPVGNNISNRIWVISLYRGTVAHQNFVHKKSGWLQLLQKKHSILVPTLGGYSGSDYKKDSACAKLGFPWIEPTFNSSPGLVEGAQPLLLSGCKAYLHITMFGELIDAGSHDVAVCKVIGIYEESKSNSIDSSEKYDDLNTAYLRSLNIISEAGRITEFAKDKEVNTE